MSVIVSAGNSPYRVSANQIDTGDVVVSGGSMFVLSGGVADGTTVSSGGFLAIERGGTDSGTVLEGIEVIRGTDLGATVSGGTAVVIAGGTDSGATIDSGGLLKIIGGSVAVDDTIASGGKVIVQGGGVDIDVTISSGGTGIVLGGGTIAVESGATSVIDGTLVNLGKVKVEDGGALVLTGAVDNAGVIYLLGGSSSAILSVENSPVSGSGLILSGHGVVLLTDNSGNLIGSDLVSGGVSSATLTNVDNKIEGAGTIGDANLAIVNEKRGVIDATGIHNPLILTTPNSPLQNAGTLEATVRGALIIENTTVLNSRTGVIAAIGVSANVDLDAAAISGGTVVTHGARAAIETVSGTSNSISDGTIWDGAFVEVTSGTTLTLNDETIRPGARVIVESGGALTVSGGIIKPGATVATEAGGSATISGSLDDDGKLIAEGSGSRILIAGAVSGRAVEIDDGTVEIQSSGNENVVFRPGGSGGLQLDGLGSAYGGKVYKFGQDDSQFIDFANISAGATVSYTSANAANTSGTLSVTDGVNSATVTLVGHYTLANFTAGDDGSGHLKITDPPVAGLPAGGATIALFGNYIAASFAGVAGVHGGGLIADVLQTAEQQLLASHPKT